MARVYTVTPQVRIVNRLVSTLNRFGLAGPNTYTLTTTGRRSGEPRSTPVTIVQMDDARYLVAPYGPVGWVHNLRHNPVASLTRKGKTKAITGVELASAEAGPVLQRYVGDVKIVRPYFDAAPDAPVADFVAEASRHPVFRIES